MRLPAALFAALFALAELCAQADAGRIALLTGVQIGAAPSVALHHGSVRAPARRLLQGGAAASNSTDGRPPDPLRTPPPAAVVINGTGGAAAPSNNNTPGNFAGAQFGFQFNNNVAFIGVAIVLGLAMSCFWGACGLYRRRRMAAHRFSGPPRRSDVPEVQLVPTDTKLTVQPIVVIQPDNQSIAYTFRELEPHDDKGSKSEAGVGSDAVSAAAGGTDQPGSPTLSPAGAAGGVAAEGDNVGSHGAGDTAADASSGDGAAPSVPSAGQVAAAAAAGEPAAPAPAQPAATGQAGQAAGGAGRQQPPGSQRGEAEAALHEAGLLRRQSSSRRRQTLGIPQLLEWDLGAALAALDAERSATGQGQQPSLSRAVSAVLGRSPSGNLPGGVSRSASGVLAVGSRTNSVTAMGVVSRTPSQSVLTRSPSGSLAAVAGRTASNTTLPRPPSQAAMRRADSGLLAGYSPSDRQL